MPRHSDVAERLKFHYKQMGVNDTHPLFKKLIPFTTDFKQYIASSRIDKRALMWALLAYMQHIKGTEESPAGLLNEALQRDLNKLKPKRGSSAGMLSKLSKKQEAAEFLVKATPSTAARFQSRLVDSAGLGKSEYSIDALTPSRPTHPSGELPSDRTPLMKAKGGLYQRELAAPSLKLYRKVAPPILEPVSVPLSQEKLDELKQAHPQLFEPKPDTFSFQITKNGIISRQGIPRPVSQGAVIGMSASEIFKKFGLISINTPWGTHYHLAHRQGWVLGGSQSHWNLDAATAGSNYHTLFFIESPAKSLVLKEEVGISVQGQVYYHRTLPIPIKITYTLRWGNGREIQKSIYPLDPEAPKRGSHLLAEAAFFSVRTPKRKAEDEAADKPAKKTHLPGSKGN